MSDDGQSPVPKTIQRYLSVGSYEDLRPVQKKAVSQGLFTTEENLLISSPTASGKTLVAEMAMLHAIFQQKKRVLYIVPLKALASEKYKSFRADYV